MTKTGPFDKYPSRYEEWFDRNKYVYQSELNAVRELLPKEGRGVEIGVGTGRFAAPLGIGCGVEPSAEMAGLAGKKGIEVIRGAAEKLPLDDGSFDFALMVTTVCFLDDVEDAFSEAHRILKPGGSFVAGFVDKQSRLGKLYQLRKERSRFYGEAVFYSAAEVISYLMRAGFRDFESVQTLFSDLSEVDSIEPVREGFGEGSFVVLRGLK
ncbi:MAG: methyltransferase domain-containing protein [Candidatus Krumholzibacteriales bacterium]